MSKGEQTRQRIVARAANVFNVRGFAGTSMGDLIQATGLEKGGIYNHFPSKEALALAAFDYAVALIGQHYQKAIAGKERALDRLIAIMGVFQRHVENPMVPGGCPVLNTAVEADDTSPVLREHAQAAMTSWHKLIGRIIKAGVLSGELRPEADPYVVASIMTATLEGALMLSRLYDDPTHLRRAVAHLISYLESLALPAPQEPQSQP